MDIWEVLLIAIGLSIDVFVVLAYMGAGFSKINKKNLVSTNNRKITKGITQVMPFVKPCSLSPSVSAFINTLSLSLYTDNKRHHLSDAFC